ncbi:MAG: C10 family peptidase [Candidatus Aminicenantes bacterium]|nr:C10 family peptidase [Candidatus Aminicenantes bacterium]
MKKLLVTAVLFLWFGMIFAAHVPFADAKQVAQNWVQILADEFRDRVTLAGGESLRRQGVVVGHVFHLAPSGFVLVAAEDYLPPVKLYSLKNEFGREGRTFEEQIIGNLQALIAKVNAGTLDPEKYFLGVNRDNFAWLKKERPLPRALMSVTPVQDAAPLLRTAWNQGDPYNALCPEINGRKPPCGCVATAFAQIFHYFQYPATGRGSHSYQWRGTSLTTRFDHPYPWDQMLLDYNETPGSTEQRNAVARLMFDLGVAFEMDYNLRGSGAYPTDALTVLPLYFKYSDRIKAIERSGVSSDEQWFAIARQQLDNGLPLAFAIYSEDVGHEVVIDGYRVSGGATSFHINMGWGGAYDAYYSLNNIMDFDVNEWQIFVYDIYPPDFLAVPPPQNTGGEAFLNESLFFSQYFCRIRWEAGPGGDAELGKYVILQRDGQGNVSTLGEVEPRVKEFTFRCADYSACSYAVVAVDRSGRQSVVKYFPLLLR